MIGRRGHSTTGLAVGVHRVRAVRVSYAPSGPRVEAAVSFRRLESTEPSVLGTEEAERIGAVLKRSGCMGTGSGWGVVLLARHGLALREVVDVPPGDTGAPVEMIARAEIARLRGFGPSSFSLAMWPLPVRQGRESQGQVMTVACPHEASKAWSDALEAAGMNVVGVVAPEEALRSLLRRTVEPEEGRLWSVAELGEDAFRCYQGLDGSIVYQREVAGLGLGDIARALSERARVPEEVAGWWLRSGDGVEVPHDLVREVCEDRVRALVRELEAAREYTGRRTGVQEYGTTYGLGSGLDVAPVHGALRGQIEGAFVRLGMSDLIAGAESYGGQDSGLLPALSAAWAGSEIGVAA